MRAKTVGVVSFNKYLLCGDKKVLHTFLKDKEAVNEYFYQKMAVFTFKFPIRFKETQHTTKFTDGIHKSSYSG